MSRSDYTEYIARISYGKDSLKMLDVIFSRGLPIDRITTTDVWATDTISANLPEMNEFKARMDDRIWWKYRMEVEHLCARNQDGSKRTYEQMFYHIPQRRSQTVQVERERRAQARIDPRIPGSMEPLVSSRTQAEGRVTECRGQSKASPERWESTGARNSRSIGCRIQGFPVQISPWCRKLKIDFPSPLSAPRGAGKQISWNTWALLPTSRHGLGS